MHSKVVTPVRSEAQLRGLLQDPKTIEQKKPPSVVGTVTAAGTGAMDNNCDVQSGVEFMSQYREDEILYNTMFSNPPICGGMVVEIGGFTGKRYSNSWFFQYALDWRALLVEALPSNFEAMVMNRPGAIHILGAICFGASTQFQTGTNRATGGIAQDMSEFHIDRWTDKSTGVLEVPCMMLSDVFKNNGIDHVDIFFLDVEGGELTVLETFDWSVPINIIVVEMDGSNPSKDENVRNILRNHGYITPFSMFDECIKKQPRCSVSELFVQDQVWKTHTQTNHVSVL